jgi:hypothetical protein
MNLKNALRFAIVLPALGSAMPALAGTITYTCDPSVATTTCFYLNTTVASNYDSTFTDATAGIYIEYGTTGLAASEAYLNDATYSSYVAALTANADQDALQASALSALDSIDAPVYGSGNVVLTAALESALGLGTPAGITSSGTACFTIGSVGCYDGLIIVTNDLSTPLYYDNLGGSEPSDAYDFYATVEHETDNLLGTASCITTHITLSDGCDGLGSGIPSAADLFRYSAPGSLVLDSSPSTTPDAYFSYNGGATNGAVGIGASPKYYNTLANDEGYADFVSSSPNCGTNQAVQDALGCPGEDAGLSILNDGGSEINILNAVGYDLTSNTTAAPEPGTVGLTMLGIGLVLVMRRRFARSVPQAN